MLCFLLSEDKAELVISSIDALKLLMPLVGGIMLFLFTAFLRMVFDRRNKLRALCIELTCSRERLPKALARLDEMERDLDMGEIRLTVFDIPSVTRSLARDLADLDPKNSHIYSDYVSYAEICNQSFSIVADLYKSLALSSSPETLVRAIGNQLRLFQGQLKTLDAKEAAVLGLQK